jgi:hypothetical protein
MFNDKPKKKKNKGSDKMLNISLFSNKRADKIPPDGLDNSVDDFEMYVMYKQDSSPLPVQKKRSIRKVN